MGILDFWRKKKNPPPSDREIIPSIKPVSEKPVLSTTKSVEIKPKKEEPVDPNLKFIRNFEYYYGTGDYDKAEQIANELSEKGINTYKDIISAMKLNYISKHKILQQTLSEKKQVISKAITNNTFIRFEYPSEKASFFYKSYKEKPMQVEKSILFISREDLTFDINKIVNITDHQITYYPEKPN